MREKPATAKLFYVFAFVPENEPNQFFILTQDETNKGIQAELAGSRARAKAKGQPHDEKDYRYNIEWDFVSKHKDAWAALPK